MSSIDLNNLLAHTGVDTSTKVPRPDPPKKPIKKLGTSTSGGQLVIKKQKQQEKQTEKKKKDQTQAPTPPPSSSTPSSDVVNRKRSSTDAAAAEDVPKRQKAKEEKLNEEGPGKTTLADLQACVRVEQSGFTLFEELQKLVAGEMTENRHLDGVLIRVTCDLYIHRDQNLTAYSEDNRDLKEELAKLKGVEEKLEAANKKVLEQQ